MMRFIRLIQNHSRAERGSLSKTVPKGRVERSKWTRMDADLGGWERLILVGLIGVFLVGCSRPKPMAGDVEALIPWLLDNRDGLEGIPFGDVIAATTGHRIVPVDAARDGEVLEELGAAIDETVKRLNHESHPIHEVGRVNEASRYVEDELREVIGAVDGWTCEVPTTEEGKEQRSGYPDLRLVSPDGRTFYLDPKLFRDGSRDSSLRTFYFEPRSATSKVREDAVHLLVGFAHNGESGSKFRLVDWELVDLSALKVQLKAEFQASNREIYVDDGVVASSGD